MSHSLLVWHQDEETILEGANDLAHLLEFVDALKENCDEPALKAVLATISARLERIQHKVSPELNYAHPDVRLNPDDMMGL